MEERYRQLTIDTCMSNKNCLVEIRTEEDTHISWKSYGETIIAFEDIPGNYPRSSLLTYRNMEEYLACLENIRNWIYDGSVVNWNLEVPVTDFTEEEKEM